MIDHRITLKYNPHHRTNIGRKATPAVRVYRSDPEGITLQNMARARVHERVAIVCRRTRACRCYLRSREDRGRMTAAVATSREGQGFSHEDCPQLFVALRMLRLRTIYRAENIGNVLKRVVNVCQRQRVNEVLGPRVTEFICNVGRENVRPIQHVFHGGLLDPMSAINLVRHSAPPKLFETPYTHTFEHPHL